MQGIDQINARAEQKRMQNMPIPQSAADYIQHLLKNPHVDAAQLGREAAAHPEVADWLKQGMAQPLPQPGTSNVGPGTGPGSPALYNPAGQGPVAGPGGGVQSYSPQMPGPTQDDQTYGTNGQRPSGPGLGTVGQARQGPHEQSLGMLGYSQQGSMQGVGDGGASFMRDARTSLGQPMQSPQVSPQAAQAAGPGFQPGGGPQVPRQDFGTPKFSGGDTMSYRELNALQPTINGAQASQRATGVAQINANAKGDTGDLRSQTQAFIAKLNVDEKDRATLSRILLGTNKEEGQQQRFVEGEKGKNERAKIGAEATKSAAGTRAAAIENPDEKDLRKVRDNITTLQNKTDWEQQPGPVAQMEEYRRQLRALSQKLGKPYAENAGPAKPGASTAPAGVKPLKPGYIRVTLPNGAQGQIPAQAFDPNTMKIQPN